MNLAIFLFALALPAEAVAAPPPGDAVPAAKPDTSAPATKSAPAANGAAANDAAANDATAKGAPTAGAPPLVTTTVSDFSAFVDDVKAKIVHLEIQDGTGHKLGTGTGFVVRSSGVVVTNEHVANIGPKIVAVFDNKDRIRVSGAWVRDAEHDIAILQLAERPSPYPALKLGNTKGLRPGAPIAVVGSPLGFNHSLSNGMVSAIRPRGLEDARDATQKQRLLQITAPVSPGSSGSPVMLLDGTVVGVATLALTGRAQALNFAVPIDVVTAHLATLDAEAKAAPLTEGGTKPKVAPTPLATTPWVNLVITLGFLLLLGGFIFWLSRRER